MSKKTDQETDQENKQFAEENSGGAGRVTGCPLHASDVDLFSPGAPEYWYDAYDVLHRESPVHCIPGEGYLPGTDAYVLTKHEDIAAVVRDQERFPLPSAMYIRQLMDADGDPLDQPGANVLTASMTSLRPNPEMWRAHRQELTDPWVGPGASRNEAMIRQVANDRVDRFIERGEVEFVGEFAQPVPHTVMANILGWPLDDLALLKHFGDGTVKPFVYGAGHRNVLPAAEVESQFEVLEQFRTYTNDLIRSRRKSPRDDMISFLAQVEYSPLERRLTDMEINGVVYAMVIGGLETTQYALAEQVQLVIEREGVWEAIREDRAKVRAFTEEGMRLRSPTQGLSTRITGQDEVFQGVTVPKGSFLHLRWAAANIDPDEWEDAQALKLDRKAGTRHLTFSQGARVCPGAHLSRLEQITVWNTLLDRVKTFRYGAGNDFVHQPGIMLGTLKLNLEFDAC